MCVKCFSTRLRIKKLHGFERLMFLLTRQRKYVCCDCLARFRQPDRRMAARFESTCEPPISVKTLKA